MNSAASSFAQFISPSVLASSTLGNLVDVQPKTSSNYSAPMEQTTEDGRLESHKDTGESCTDGWSQPDRHTVRSTTMANAATTLDSTMASPLSSQPRPYASPNDPQASGSLFQSSTSSPQPPSSVAFPKPNALGAGFSSQLIPPTPPMAVTPGVVPNRAASPQNSPRLSRPHLTARLSSRAGGKRHASIGSARELPFPIYPSTSGATDARPPSPSQATLTQSSTSTPTGNAAESATPGWNARLRELGLHLPGLGSPRTPKSPRSGSSGGATPRSPEDHRGASYFSFRRRGSSGNAISPGKRSGAPTPPPPPPPPVPALTKPPQRHQPKAMSHSPISEESTPPPSGSSTRSRRANLSLDFGSALAARGSTASLPLIGHTPVQHLVQGEPKLRRGSMVSDRGGMGLPTAPPPHVHTPPVQPPAYEYPFLPNHAPRKPLEVRVEEVPPGNGPMEAGSWVISVR
ncbi:hypothetical protein BDV93DRAFT_97434 [Ceratobasidium sp. AG-I]|nr:hypothetical protein BDV93DRAFT_97434 [Ceratobasidium sp. AG-I]